MRSIAHLFFSYFLLLPPASAGYAEEFLMGTIMSYGEYCEEMSSEGLDNFSAYVVKYSGSVENMNNSKGYQSSYKLFVKSLKPKTFRPTACNQIKKALKRKEAYWVFEN